MAYQLIIARLDGYLIGDRRYEERIEGLARQGIGGFILFGGRKEPVSRFVRHLQTLSPAPLFIASDVERGVGQQIEDTTRFPSQMAIAAAIRGEEQADVNLLAGALHAWTTEARDVGINMVFSPVLDVNSNPENPIICTRAFSDDPATVSWFAGRYIDAFNSEGLLCCAKHFPGHGDTETDSHISLPRIDRALQDLWKADLPPFADAINRGVPCIMAGHLLIPSLDSLPASLSPGIIRGLLRGSMGFKGLVITDALNMHAVNDYQETAAMSLGAGADILLHPADPDLAVTEICDSLDRGMLQIDVIEQAVGRVLGAKKGLLTPAQSATVDYGIHRDIARTLFARSVTVLKQSAHLRDKSLAQGRLLVAVAEKFNHEASPLRALPLTGADVRDRDVLIALFPSVAAWKGSSGISERDIGMVHSVIRRARSSIVVSFGSPYVLRHFADADTLIAMYDDADSAQESFLLWLSGVQAAVGRCPVRMPL